MKKRKGKIAVQKLVGTALLVAAICGFISHSNIVAVVIAAGMGIAFLVSRKIIFEI